MLQPKPEKTILLVEDEALIAMNEADVLEKNGYEVITAYNGEKAIESVKQNDIDLILMDIDLGKGKMDGTETAEIILREHDIPVVFLSSHTEPEVVEKTEKITSYGYIVKNSGDTVLLASLKMAFRLFEANLRIKKHEEELIKEKKEQPEEVTSTPPKTKLEQVKEDIRKTFQEYKDNIEKNREYRELVKKSTENKRKCRERLDELRKKKKEILGRH